MRDRILEAFGQPASGAAGDLAGTVWPAPAGSGETTILRSAAVLVPLIEHATGMTVLLTQRTDTLPHHAGQICFPGGRIEDRDRTPEDTALRETEEEIGIGPSGIELVGRMKAHETGTGFRVIPVIGLLAPPLALAPDPSEVAQIFEVPLDFVLDPENHRFETRVSRGVERRFPALTWREHFIWGLTARILGEMAEVLRRS